MATFAKIGLDSKVIGSVSLEDSVLKDADDNTQESLGINYLTELYGWAIWKQSFDDGTRKNPGGIGYEYDSTRDAFIGPKPFTSWILDESTCGWEPPVARPDSGYHTWNEGTTSWDAV